MYLALDKTYVLKKQKVFYMFIYLKKLDVFDIIRLDVAINGAYYLSQDTFVILL